jgi:hypothetical protein
VLLIRAHGLPSVAEVFALAAGSLLAFSLMALLVGRIRLSWEPLGSPSNRILAGALNWVAVGVAITAVAFLATICGWEAWPLSSFVATSLYVLFASAQLAIVTEMSDTK